SCQELQQTKSVAARNRTSDLPDSGRPEEPKGYNAFRKQQLDLDTDSCMIVADFKENFRIGGGPVEASKNVFSKLFTRNHGKSDVDGHFGFLSRWFRDAEKQQDILSIEDLVTCFKQKSSQNGSTRGLDANDEAYKFYIYSKDMPRVDRHQIKIDGGIKLNLSYYFVNEKLFASPICFEDLSLYNPVAYKIVKAKDKRKDKYTPDQIQRMNSGDALMGPSSIRIQMKREEMLRGW
ncbi:hypothetical protein BB560_003896, partial [Smittium megazygosporum]